MESGYIALGILSILYYILLAWYSKRLNGTFMFFWLAFAVVQFVLAWIVSLTPDWGDTAIVAITGLCSLIFSFIELVILCAMVAVPHNSAEYIIILGAQVRGKKITESLRRRLDKGVRYLERNPKTMCIVSGGQGKNEDVSEAEAMRDYLLACGVEAERIILEDKSTTTCENLVNSREYIRDINNSRVGIVSNNFHIYRAMKMAKALGYKKSFALPASTNLIVFPNYMVREFFAFFIMFRELKNYE